CAGCPRVGFPIRTSRDQRLVSTSPALIAAAHVLLRLLAPRHPPCALVLLIEKNTCIPLWSFQGARGPAPTIREEPPSGTVSQNSAARRSCRGRHSSRRDRSPDVTRERVTSTGRPSPW